MNLLSELITAVQSDLNVNSSNTFFTETIIKSAINRAYTKCAGLFLWPETEDAKKTSTQTNQEYYDYPQNWRPDSIWKLTVDEEDYSDPLSFDDYLYEKENGIPSGNDKLWANHWRRYFIYPTPTSAGDYNISVWGQRIPDSLSVAADVTIWSYSMPECNEAVILEAVKILNNKKDKQQAGELLSAEAKQILIVAWSKIKKSQDKYRKTRPFFSVPDYFCGNGRGSGEDIENYGKF